MKDDRGQNWHGQDWSNANPEIAKIILAQGETHLQAQWQAALAADSRAISIARVCVTAALAVLGAGLTFWQGDDGTTSHLLATLAAGGSLFIGAVFAVYAARPSSFNYPGNEPKNWYADKDQELIVEAVGGEAENYQASIAENNVFLRSHKNWTLAASGFFVASPLLGLIGWFIPYLACWT